MILDLLTELLHGVRDSLHPFLRLVSVRLVGEFQGLAVLAHRVLPAEEFGDGPAVLFPQVLVDSRNVLSG